MHADQPEDRNFEAQLRAVPTPPQLVERLRAALLPTDDQLDARLRDVASPPTLLVRLQSIPEDVLLDKFLADVPVPAGFVNRLRSVPVKVQPVSRTQSWRRQLGFLSAAAALVWILLSVGGASFSWWFAETAALIDGQEDRSVLLIERPFQFAATNSTASNDAQFVSAESLPFNWKEDNESPIQAEGLVIDAPEEATAAPPVGPVGEWFTAVHDGMKPWASVVQMRWGILGAPYDDRDQVLLEQPFVANGPGLEPPLVKGYNRAFWLKHHVFPPLSPSIDGLESLPLPLEGNAFNFDRLEQLALASRKPAEREVRVEDFVAHALGIVPAARTGTLELDIAAASSPFGPKGTQLLQCLVKAGPAPSAQPSHLVIALDLSSSMRQHWPEIQRTLLMLPERLGPDDRLSLIAFGEEVVLALEAFSASDWPVWREQVQKLQPLGTADLAEGFRAAITVSLGNGELLPNASRELVFISDHEGTWNRQSLKNLADLLATGRNAGVKLRLVDLAARVDDRSSCLAILAREAEVECYGHVATGPRGERQSPLQSWQQIRFPPIGSEVELSIHFNPQAVAAYRLIGHDGASWSEIQHSAQPLEFRPGDSRSAQVELLLHPGRFEEVGRLELRWRNPADGEYIQQQVRLTRSQFLASWQDAPLWFQRSCLAAEVAEVLRGSREALREADWSAAEHHDLARVLALWRQCPKEFKNDPVNARLVRSVEAWRRLGIK